MSDTELVIKINGDAKGYDQALKETTDKTSELQGRLNSIAKTGAVAFAGFTGAIAYAANQAGKFETIQTQFEVLTGSVKEAQDTIKNLSDFSAKTPFKFEQISQAGKQLLGFQVQAEDLVPTLKRIGDVSAATGAGFNDLTLIFGQVKAAGKLTGERLLQLQERAIPIGPALAKTMGVTESAVKDMVSKGLVNFDTFEKAFASLSAQGGIAFGGMEKNSKTLEGQLSTLSDNFSLVTAEVGKNFLPVLKATTSAFINMLEFIRSNPGLTNFISKALVAGTVVAGLTTAVALGVSIFIKLRASMIASTIATRGLSFAVKGLIGATGLGLLVAFLPEILELFKRVFTGVKNIVAEAGGAISKMIGSLGMILKGLFTFDIDAIKQGLNDFKSAFSKVAEATANEFNRKNNDIQKAEQKTTDTIIDENKKRKASEDSKTKSFDQATEDRKQKIRDELEVAKASMDNLEKAEIELIKRRQALDKEFKDTRIIQDQEEKALAIEANKLKYEQLLLDEEEYYLMRDELRAEQQEKEDALKAELEELTAAQREMLQQSEIDSLQKSYKTKAKIRSEAIKAEIEDNRKKNEEFIKDEVKYGTVLANFRAAMRSDEVKNAESLAGNLVKLQDSKNAQMKQIGKTAALTQIGIDTARGAIAAYQSLAGIPYVGPALGIAAAAALTAYGFERAGQVRAAKSGGMVEGVGYGDKIPFMLEPGELITPRQNFDEVVSAVARQRGFENGRGDVQGEIEASVIVGFDGEAADLLTVKQNEQRFLKTSQQI